MFHVLCPVPSCVLVLFLSLSFFLLWECFAFLSLSPSVAFSILRCRRVDKSASLPHLAISYFCVFHVVRGVCTIDCRRILCFSQASANHNPRSAACASTLPRDSAEIVVVLTEWFSRVQRANFESIRFDSRHLWRNYFPEKYRRTDTYVYGESEREERLQSEYDKIKHVTGPMVESTWWQNLRVSVSLFDYRSSSSSFVLIDSFLLDPVIDYSRQS